MRETAIELMSGAIVAASFAIGLYFLRFWRQTGDRFFVLFSAAFWTFGSDRIAQALTHRGDESRTYIYLVRLLAFVLILIAILDKNRSSER